MIKIIRATAIGEAAVGSSVDKICDLAHRLVSGETLDTAQKGNKDGGKIDPNGSEIKRRRKLSGVSQEKLSELTGISLKTLRNLESNPHYSCRASTLAALASFFKVEPRILVQQPAVEKTLRLLTSAAEIISANKSIVETAKTFLVCTGSRSRDQDYLSSIETALVKTPELVHYRVMSWPPFKKVFQKHLLNLLKIRDVKDRSLGYKTLHIGLYRDIAKQPESCLCANESLCLIVLPSFFGIGEYNTALFINNPSICADIIAQCKAMYQAGSAVENDAAILEMGLVKNGELYE